MQEFKEMNLLKSKRIPIASLLEWILLPEEAVISPFCTCWKREKAGAMLEVEGDLTAHSYPFF